MRTRERGASLVEVSLVLPILLALAIGLSEIGFLVIDFISETRFTWWTRTAHRL
jgi:hypothetical protein